MGVDRRTDARDRVGSGLQRVREHRPSGIHTDPPGGDPRNARSPALAALRRPRSLQRRRHRVLAGPMSGSTSNPDSVRPGERGRVLNEEMVAEAARALSEADRTRTPMRKLSLQYPEMTIE